MICLFEGEHFEAGDCLFDVEEKNINLPWCALQYGKRSLISMEKCQNFVIIFVADATEAYPGENGGDYWDFCSRDCRAPISQQRFKDQREF